MFDEWNLKPVMMDKMKSLIGNLLQATSQYDYGLSVTTEATTLVSLENMTSLSSLSTTIPSITTIPMLSSNLSNNQVLISNQVFQATSSAWTLTEIVVMTIVSIFLNFITLVGNIMVLISFKMDRS